MGIVNSGTDLLVLPLAADAFRDLCLALGLGLGGGGRIAVSCWIGSGPFSCILVPVEVDTGVAVKSVSFWCCTVLGNAGKGEVRVEMAGACNAEVSGVMVTVLPGATEARFVNSWREV